jgi:hypothetical protein
MSSSSSKHAVVHYRTVLVSTTQTVENIPPAPAQPAPTYNIVTDLTGHWLQKEAKKKEALRRAELENRLFLHPYLRAWKGEKCIMKYVRIQAEDYRYHHMLGVRDMAWHGYKISCYDRLRARRM